MLLESEGIILPKLNIKQRFAKAKAQKVRQDEYLVFRGLYSFFNFSQEDLYIVLSRRIDWIDFYDDYDSWKAAWNNRPLSFWNKETVRDEINNWMSLLKDEVFSCMNEPSQFNRILKRYEKLIEEEREVLGWD